MHLSSSICKTSSTQKHYNVKKDNLDGEKGFVLYNWGFSSKQHIKNISPVSNKMSKDPVEKCSKGKNKTFIVKKKY